LIGLGLPDDGAHGPNEKFALDDFHRGMVVMAALIDRVSQRGS
jgi:acetylornithine deacetylase/succinyl-diaminopimelate desuccinylase-like protein